MKQIIQNLKTGKTEIVDVPIPALGRGAGRSDVGSQRSDEGAVMGMRVKKE
jgi:hypothetical protein